MTIPSTGTTWRGSHVADVDSRFNDRTGLAGIAIRDNRGAATNISPWAAGSPPTRNWSPFALDGKIRSDLFAAIRVNGEWTTNPDPNEGFWQIGALSEDGGPERATEINNDNQMILQSNAPFDSILTTEGRSINFTGVETLKPMMKRLRMNLALSDSSGNSIVEDPGQENFVIGKPVDSDAVDRQILAFFAKKVGGKYLYTCEGYGLCRLNNIGNFRRSKTDPDAGELGYMVLPDPFLVSKDPNNPDSDELIPVMWCEWQAGDGWTAIGGLPVWPGSAPVATQTGTTTATVSAADPTGAGDPFTITWEKAVSPFTTWTAATVGSITEDTPSAGFTTYNITGLTTATQYKFRGTAEGTNGQTATTQDSNSITTA